MASKVIGPIETTEVEVLRDKHIESCLRITPPVVVSNSRDSTIRQIVSVLIDCPKLTLGCVMGRQWQACFKFFRIYLASEQVYTGQAVQQTTVKSSPKVYAHVLREYLNCKNAWENYTTRPWTKLNKNKIKNSAAKHSLDVRYRAPI